MKEDFLTAQEVADYYRIPLGTFYNWRGEGKGPRAYRVGRYIRFKASEVVAWIEARAEERAS